MVSNSKAPIAGAKPPVSIRYQREGHDSLQSAVPVVHTMAPAEK